MNKLEKELKKINKGLVKIIEATIGKRQSIKEKNFGFGSEKF